MTKVFVYGTLKKGYWNHSRFMKNAHFLGTCQTADRYVMIGLGSTVPMILSSGKGKPVRGELYEVPESDMPAIDRLEGGYRKIRKYVVMDSGKAILASYYVGRDAYGSDTPKWDAGNVFNYHLEDACNI